MTELTVRAAELAVYGRPPAAAREVVRNAIADTVAVALAARHEPVIVALESQLTEGGPSLVWTSGAHTSAADAALANGTAAHALDFDDHSDALRGHPSAVLVPALLAAAGEDPELEPVADAYAVGFQLACALAAGVNLTGHYRRGWHATSTLLTVAAAAAVARLDGLDARRTAHAIALGSSMAGGLRCQFGSDAKPVHAGLAARNGVVATRLATAGVTAAADALEGVHGFLAVYGEPADLKHAEAVLTGEWRLGEGALHAKRHPCCGALQRIADAALALAEELGPGAADVEQVRVTIEPGGSMPLAESLPGSGTEARFSAPYVVAAALSDRMLGLDTFTDTAVARPAVRELAARVELHEAERPPAGPPDWLGGYATVQAGLGGDVVTERADALPGCDRDKIRALAGDELADALLAGDLRRLSPLMAATAAAAPR